MGVVHSGATPTSAGVDQLLCAVDEQLLDAVRQTIVLKRPLTLDLAAMGTALLPGAVVLLAGGAVFLTWLTVQQLPDVLMVVGLGTLGVGALMVVLGAVLVRPLMHLGLHNLWSRRAAAE